MIAFLLPFWIFLSGFSLVGSRFSSLFFFDKLSKRGLHAETRELRHLLDSGATATMSTLLWSFLGLGCLLAWVRLRLLGVAIRSSWSCSTVALALLSWLSLLAILV